MTTFFSNENIASAADNLQMRGNRNNPQKGDCSIRNFDASNRPDFTAMTVLHWCNRHVRFIWRRSWGQPRREHFGQASPVARGVMFQELKPFNGFVKKREQRANNGASMNRTFRA